MQIWIGNILLLVIFAGFIEVAELKKKSKTSLLLIIVFLQLLFLYILKDNTIFKDIGVYLLGFDFSRTVGWNEVYKIQHFASEDAFEIGWCYYNKILSSLFNDSIVLLIVTGSIILISYLTIIKNNSLIPWFSIFLFIAIVFYNSLFVLRQNLSVAICLFSIPYIIKRKFLKFVVFILIAFSVHQTALIFIILYFLYPIKINKKYFIRVFFIAILFYSSFKFFLAVAATYLKGFLIYLGEIDQGTNLTLFIISICVVLYIFITYYPYNQIDDNNRVFFHMLIMFFLIELSRIGLPGTIGRLNLYFFPSIIILIPNACKQIKNPIIRFFSITAIFVLYFIFMIQQMDYGFKLIF